MLSLLQSRYETETSLKCVQLDGQGLGPIEDKSIDAAFSFDVFVHLEQWDIFNYLCELKRVLKPGGKAIIHHGNSLSRLGWRRFVAETRQQLNTPKIWGTFSFMSPNVFKELSERAGLHHINCITDIVRRDGISLLQSPAS
jgi:ubiquinone/menaquinone biosynthesis C-methylase UbiE